MKKTINKLVTYRYVSEHDDGDNWNNLIDKFTYNGAELKKLSWLDYTCIERWWSLSWYVGMLIVLLTLLCCLRDQNLRLILHSLSLYFSELRCRTVHFGLQILID